MSKIVIYGVGGCGANLVQDFIRIPEHQAWGKVESCIIDTSKANLRVNSAVPYYLVPGMEGGGGVRSVAHNGSKDHIPEMLSKFQPGTLNIVIFSLSGATGSSIGPTIVAELLRRGAPVVVMGVGSVESGKRSDNTIKTLMSLQNLAARTNMPVPMFYYQNSDADGKKPVGRGTRVENNAVIEEDVRLLTLLASEKHHALDRADLTNFLAFNKVTNVRPQLVEIILATRVDLLDSYDGYTISSASLMHTEESKGPALQQPYECQGFYKPEIVEGMDNPPELHLITTTRNLEANFRELKAMNELFEESTSRLNGISSIQVDAASGDDDLIL